MSTKAEEMGLVRRLSKVQLAVLREHCDRDWDNDSVSSMLLRLREEVNELEEAIIDRHSQAKVWREAADCANFAAMIADIYEREQP